MPVYPRVGAVLGTVVAILLGAGIVVPAAAAAAASSSPSAVADAPTAGPSSASSTATATPSASASAPAAPSASATTGTLELLTADPVAGEALTFRYSTDRPVAKNWVGVYDDPADGPTDQAYHAPSTAYTYTSDATSGDGSSGTLTVSGAGLTPGHDVTAYFLYDDGYTWLAQPVTFRVATPAPATGSLTLLTKDPVAGAPLTFSYSTDRPTALDWVGVYDDPADGPTDQEYHAPSTAYTYTGDHSSGTVTVSGAGLTSGHDVTAYLLYDDGYTWLAQPLTFRVSDPPPYDPTPTTAHFVTDTVTEAATPPVSAVSVDVAGLWFGAGGSAPSAPVSFVKTGGSGWLRVDAAGHVTGTTPADPRRVRDAVGSVTITATDTTGVTGRITVEFPLARSHAAPQVKAATLDMWDGGTHVADAREKAVRSVLVNRLDVVGLQDTLGTQATAVARSLGWGHVETSGGQAVISRWPIAADRSAVPTGLPAVAATVDVNGSRIHVWSAQLDSDGFGPAAACAAHATAPASHSAEAKAIVAAERATLRYRQARVLASAIARQATRSEPTVLLADTESPGSADWRGSTSATHCGIGRVDWPVPAALAAVGLDDTYRAAHPDAARDPGQTTSVFPGDTAAATARVDAGTAAATSGSPTPTTDGPERVDTVQVLGRVGVSESHTLVDGYPKGPPDTAGNAWISDRAAVVSTLTLH